MDIIEGIILAAGLSKRTGTCKMLLDIDGIALIERCILGMYDVCSKIIVVGGHNFNNIARIITKYDKVKMVYNQNYLHGMFSSVKEGFQNVSGDRFFFTPGDYPFIKRQTYKDMLKVKGDIIIPAFCGKKGHPILVKTQLSKELIEDTECSTLRHFIEDKNYITIEVEDQGILMDIDTMDDYRRITKSMREGFQTIP